jgi:predicted ester cyclase
MKLYKILILTAALAFASCSNENAAHDAMHAKADTIKAAHKAVLAAIVAGNPAELDKYISESMIDHTPSPGQKPGLAGLKEWVVSNKACFPDFTMTIEDTRVDGDVFISRIRMKGTNTGPMMGMPPTGKAIDVMFLDMGRWENGKFVEHWGYLEEMKMMTQLGLIPPMGDAPAAEKK